MDGAVVYKSSAAVDMVNVSVDITFPWAPSSAPFPSSSYPNPDAEPGQGGPRGEGQEQVTLAYIAIFSSLFFAVTTVGICGNVMVIYIILSDKKMRGSPIVFGPSPSGSTRYTNPFSQGFVSHSHHVHSIRNRISRQRMFLTA
ncbi:hypothetical protein RRG08_046794 [Elysia crispata]|uniref:Uncharacterized protein n=1 Tax=Elysia crispata TaxID=231223 RepID=A0AAE0ZWV9_9GAST|nr:hypothetical protein RRG08_046794 [Elysia crispata]